MCGDESCGLWFCAPQRERRDCLWNPYREQTLSPPQTVNRDAERRCTHFTHCLLCVDAVYLVPGDDTGGRCAMVRVGSLLRNFRPKAPAAPSVGVRRKASVTESKSALLKAVEPEMPTDALPLAVGGSPPPPPSLLTEAVEEAAVEDVENDDDETIDEDPTGELDEESEPPLPSESTLDAEAEETESTSDVDEVRSSTCTRSAATARPKQPTPQPQPSGASPPACLPSVAASAAAACRLPTPRRCRRARTSRSSLDRWSLGLGRSRSSSTRSSRCHG